MSSGNENELWREYLVEVAPPGDLKDKIETIPICGLCGNTGIVETFARTPYGTPCGVCKPCICPNGRAMKKEEQE